MSVVLGTRDWSASRRELFRSHIPQAHRGGRTVAQAYSGRSETIDDPATERDHSLLSQAMLSRDRPSEPQIPGRVSYYRRQSSMRPIDAFIPTRRFSLSHIQYDKRWWSEVAAHGGCTARANRHLSTLAPFLEPEAALQASDFDGIHLCECGKSSSMQSV